MSDFGFTPGPWRTSKTPMDDFAVFAPFHDGESHVVAIINQDERLAGNPKNNLRLIKEASNLLQAALAFHEIVCEEHPHLAATRQAHALRAAITEATGEKWKVTT